MGHKGGGNIAGYKYYMGVFMGLCRGAINELVEIRVGDLQAWPTGAASVTGNTSFAITEPQLFGGEEKEGGIDGTVQIFFGGDAQVLPNDVKASLNGVGVAAIPTDLDLKGAFPATAALDPIIVPAGAGLVPGYRGVTTMFFRGEIAANNSYPKPWKMRLRRTTAGWDGGIWYEAKAKIQLSSGLSPTHPTIVDIIAMNPAHIIYECATNTIWGRGLNRALLDDLAFRQCADALYDEGLGLCLRWTRTDTLENFIQIVVDHCGAALYIDRRTGLLTMKLIRADYDATTLPVFSLDSGLLAVVNDDASSSDGMGNEIIVKFHDPVKDQARQIRAQNLASIQSLGRKLTTSIDYSGIPTPDLASRIALRDLRTQASSLKRFTLKMDRRGWRLNPAEVFRIHVPSRGIEDMILRVGKIEDGNSGDGTITVTCIQDIFGMPATGFTTAQVPLWTPPDPNPLPAPRRALMEASYRDLVRSLTPGNLAAFDPLSGHILTMASRPVDVSGGYSLETKTGSEAYVVQATCVWTASGRLIADITELAGTFTIDRGIEYDVITVPGAVLIDNEWLGLTAFNPTTGLCTVSRGCIDTVPAQHLADAVVFFGDNREGTDRREYLDSEVVSAKVLTQTGSQVLADSAAPADTVTIVRRQFRPYPPGNVQIDGVVFSTVQPIPSTPATRVVTWSHRDRLTELDDLIPHQTGNIGPEAGTTYTIRVYRWTDNVLRRTVTGIAGTTWNYTMAMQGADGCGDRARIEIESVRDGLASFQRYSIGLYLYVAGWGYRWGSRWGGSP